MRLEGKIFVANKVARILDVDRQEDELKFHKQVENCLLEICQCLDISPPLWMQKNTYEFARFHQTVFTAEQFIEDVYFDRFQLTWLDDGKNI